MKKIIFMMASAFVAFAFFGCGGGGSTETPESVAEKFLNHLSKNEFKEAKALAVENAIKETESLETTQKEVGLAAIKFEKITCTTKDDASKCTYKMDGADCKIDLKKVDGAWKIVSVYPDQFAKPDDGEDTPGPEPTVDENGQPLDDVVEEY